MTYRELKEQFITKISAEYPPREGMQVFYMVLEDEFNLSRSAYVMKELSETGNEVIDRLNKIAEELCTGKPVQYITGKAFFDGYYYAVTKDVLIPRPETEELVRWIASEESTDSRFIDIGSGSGCIQIALALRLTESVSLGLDVSEAALDVAMNNSRTLQTDNRCSFKKLDILTEKIQERLPDWSSKIDFIVSNPPYIAPGEKDQMEGRVTRFEPHLALFSEDPLHFYRVIMSQGCQILSPGGRLYFELHEDYAEGVQNLMHENYENICIHKDLQGKSRMLRGQLKLPN